MNSIFKRRSIRKYKNQEIEKEKVKKLLEAAMNAPSAGNEQPWQYIVVDDKNLLKEMSKMSPYSKMTADAPLAILVCGDTSKEVYEDFWVQDCSAAVQNILIEAVELGLGSVWLGVYPLQDRVDYLKKLFNIKEEHIIPFALLPIGYPAQNTLDINRYKEDRVHYNKW